MPKQPTSRLTRIALAGAALLLAATAARLPNPRALLHPPQTPYDRSNPRLAPAFLLLTEAAAVLPARAWVTITSEPKDPALDTDTHRVGIALLPGRVVLPSASWGIPRPELARAADYVVIVGTMPAAVPGDLLLARPEGSVWRKRP